LQRLARQLQTRDFSNGNEEFAKNAEALVGATGRRDLSDELKAVPASVTELAKVTERLQDHLEDEYQTLLRSKQLFAAQREECPPQYRPLVNQYFESLSAGAQ